MANETKSFDNAETAIKTAFKLRNKEKYVCVIYCGKSKKFFIEHDPGLFIRNFETVVLEFVKGERAPGYGTDQAIITEFSNK
jgi:hypothetical protein